MTPDGQVEYVSVAAHRRPSQPVSGPVGTAFSTVLAWQQWQSGDKTGAAVTAGFGLLNSVGIDASAARVVLSGLKEEQAAATVGLDTVRGGEAAASSSVSNTWKAYENGAAGAAQPSLLEGYSWVKNAEGDLGIKTPEGKVVSDSQGKTDIISDAGNEFSVNGSDKKTIIDSKGNALVGDWSATQKLTAPENALSHWIKHSSEFPEYSNASQYVEGAQTFVSKPPSNVLIKTRANGDTLLYDPLSNTFAVKTVDGTPRTMFRPADGINYWRKQ